MTSSKEIVLGETTSNYTLRNSFGESALGKKNCPGWALFKDLYTFLEDPLAPQLKLDDAAGNEDG